ncbi:49bbed85-180d-4e96-a9e7-043d553f45ae [Sclerotinia trifoliorum]|uniref:49bbed85-180d-4e96-a9e7-043d553f45ae n=1 Tax=Sclerotinia trifoliorum TaxID=28548 RepID=A0A8H2W0P2_9HELO|nr:49bbed85-180d-4e96-a9e7-043d553f45ae [Sclerotinia trifoliorum]
MASRIELSVSVQLNGHPLFRSPQLAISSTRARAIQSIIDKCAQEIEYQLTRAGADERRDAEKDRRCQEDTRELMENHGQTWDARF